MVPVSWPEAPAANVPGDIHENASGSAAMAKKIWGVMEDKCIAQPTSSGCCEE
jgi:hypothetical protein